jgi:hypothetical protein
MCKNSHNIAVCSNCGKEMILEKECQHSTSCCGSVILSKFDYDCSKEFYKKLEPKFALNEKVKVINGFYRGYKGEIKGYVKKCKFKWFFKKVIWYEYSMWVNHNKYWDYLHWIEEKDLMRIK